MIRLSVENYCENCPEFEPHVHKDKYELYSVTNPESVVHTLITCEHQDRCNQIKKMIQQEMDIKDSQQEKEIK